MPLTPSRRSAFVVAALALAAGCVDRLPDQDLRIVAAVAVAKLPVEDLAADYRADKAAADRRYWGQPIEVSGELAPRKDPAAPLAFVDKSGAEMAVATLLDDQAKATLEALDKSRRIRLKCYCDGLATSTVRLKSCVLP